MFKKLSAPLLTTTLLFGGALFLGNASTTAQATELNNKAITTSANTDVAQENLLLNGSFDQGTKGWNYDEKYYVSIIGERGGNNFLRLTYDPLLPNTAKSVYQEVDNLEPNTLYKLQFKARGRNLRIGPAFPTAILYTGLSSAEDSSSVIPDLSPIFLEYSVTAHSDAEGKLAVFIRVSDSHDDYGQFEFDDFVLTKAVE